MDRTICRGEIYYADLEPVVGSEQGGIRPVLILQNNVGNIHSPTVIIAVITTRKKVNLPTHVYIESLPKPSFALLEQIRTVDKIRILEYVGQLSEREIKAVDNALKISVCLK